MPRSLLTAPTSRANEAPICLGRRLAVRRTNLRHVPELKRLRISSDRFDRGPTATLLDAMPARNGRMPHPAFALPIRRRPVLNG